MHQRSVHNFIWVPITLIGLIAVAIGLISILNPELWMLDKASNELIIGLSFEELFSSKSNKGLPIYIKTLYRFFGVWLISIGMLIFAYIRVTRLATYRAQESIYSVLIITLVSLFYMTFTLLPISQLKTVLVIMAFLLGISMYFSRKLI